MNKLYNGEALEIMDKLINDGVKVDCIITDPPYGILNKKTFNWDSVIPFDEMWDRINKLKRNEHTPTLLFGKQPFTSFLNMSNINEFRYEIIWEKQKGVDFMNAKRKPLTNHENISVFYKKQPNYNPQIDEGRPYYRGGNISNSKITGGGKITKHDNKGVRYPKSVRKYNYPEGKSRLHPTQKPIDLLEWLVNSYTKEGDTILDFTMGSGSTGVACKNTNRNFIGIELDEQYYNIAKERMGDDNE